MTNFLYPTVRRDDGIQCDYHGTKVTDPYRWLEDPESDETKQFVDAQNLVTMPYLESYPVRDKVRKRLTELWNYEKFSCPSKHGDRYYFWKNTGLQNQSVLYIQKTLDSEPEVFLDPNTLSEDGTIALRTSQFSEDGKIFAYGLSTSGSDWMSVHFKNVDTKENFVDVLEKVKFTELSWTHDNLGIFYACYPAQEGKTDGAETTTNTDQKLYYHRIGTDQSQDTLMVEFPENPKWLIRATVSTCGNYLIVLPSQECRDNLLYYADLIEPIKNGLKEPLNLIPIVTKFEADYVYISNEGPNMIFRTNKNAPNFRLITIDVNHPAEENWKVLIPEHPKNMLEWASAIDGDKLVVCYINDVKDTLQLHDFYDGNYLRDFPIDVGTIVGCSGKRKHSELFFHFSSYLTPGRIFHVDFKKGLQAEATVLREILLPGFDASKFVTKQVFYPSKDGTKIPMFIVHKKDLVLNGDNPCLLYGYGGFHVSVQPHFSVTRLVYMQHFDGVVCEANIRGGGEYGNWHDDGRLAKKQNCFDDFQCAAEYLIENKYTKAEKLTIQGGSNGGLLIGACVNQRPDLFGAGIAQVAVTDMLRFHKFTIGYAWCSDYGCSDSKEHFDTLIKYSPLHNVKVPENGGYPALMLLTADHDDRVVPCHSYKFISEIQYRLGTHPEQKNPLLIRIDTKAGHGAGKPTAKVIDEYTDILTFMAQTQALPHYDL